MNKYKEDTALSIINNNYVVQSIFDNVPERLVSHKHLSETKANELKVSKKVGYLTNYRVVNCVAIVGIVPFNKGLAYIFNKPFYDTEALDKITITSRIYEELMDCYVFCSNRISKKYLETLEKEYYKRGGIVYSDYYSFENLILKKVREFRKKQFINEIVFESIFKHGFREVKKNKWSNGKIKIKREQIECSSLSFPGNLKHTELNTKLENKILIGSIFGKYYDHINQLKENVFGVRCSTKNSSRYNFAYFIIIL